MPGLELRPTPDRLREALFNVLAPRIEGATFLDAYAGTGAVGIEALSRGAERAIFIEKHFGAARLIRENLDALGIADRAIMAQSAVGAALSRFEADIYFLDPPYTAPAEYEVALNLLGERTTLNAQTLVLAQHAKRSDLDESYGRLRRARVLTHGENSVSFFVVS